MNPFGRSHRRGKDTFHMEIAISSIVQAECFAKFVL